MAFELKNTGAGLENQQDYGETILGLKMTNVFGLAWNYYVGYTKFITGLDLTFDFGRKIEMFYATCFKVGYANEFKASSFKSYTLGGEGFHITGTEEAITSASTKATAEKTRMDDLVNRSITTEMKVVALEDKSGGTSVEEWTVSKDISAPVFTLLCSTGATLAAGTGLAAFSADGLSLDGLIIELA